MTSTPIEPFVIIAVGLLLHAIFKQRSKPPNEIIRPDNVPEINAYDPIPKWYFRNLPREVYLLQCIAYILMMPWALALLWMIWLWPLLQRMGIMECYHGYC